MGFSPESYTFVTMGRLQKIKSVGRVISVTLRCGTATEVACGILLVIVRIVQRVQRVQTVKIVRIVGIVRIVRRVLWFIIRYR